MLTSRRSAPGWIFSFVALLAAGAPPALRADEPIAFEKVAPLFQTHCYKCHGVDKAKGKLRIDKLDADFLKGSDADHWRDVLDRLNFGDMPPAKEPAVSKEDRELMTGWIVQELRRAGTRNPRERPHDPSLLEFQLPFSRAKFPRKLRRKPIAEFR